MLFVEIDVQDPDLYQRYTSLTPATLAQYGGRFIVRGGLAESLEGAPVAGRVVLLEFDNIERAKAWWHSPEYGAAKMLRHQAAAARMIVMDGLSS